MHNGCVWVAGIDVPASAVADLAFRLDKAGHTALGRRVGIACDTNSPWVGLQRNEYLLIVSVLGDASGALGEFREILLDEYTR